MFKVYPRHYVAANMHILLTALIPNITNVTFAVDRKSSESTLEGWGSRDEFKLLEMGEIYYFWATMALHRNKTMSFEAVRLVFSYTLHGKRHSFDAMPKIFYDTENYIYYNSSKLFNITIYTRIECDNRTLTDKLHIRYIPRCCRDYGFDLHPHPDNNSRCELGFEANKTPICLNNGTFLKTNTTNELEYFCNCTSGYFGDRCQYHSLCANCMPGKCVGANQCLQCRPGWSGHNCQNKTCTNYTLCRNNSTCKVNATHHECVCSGNYFGAYCQFMNSTTPGICEISFTDPTKLAPRNNFVSATKKTTLKPSIIDTKTLTTISRNKDSKPLESTNKTQTKSSMKNFGGSQITRAGSDLHVHSHEHVKSKNSNINLQTSGKTKNTSSDYLGFEKSYMHILIAILILAFLIAVAFFTDISLKKKNVYFYLSVEFKFAS
ncbi:Neurogenic locus notch protein 1 [Thelohanellus kitauei]|uniref:Neurogenic locus notch protein 1 n=1 Tax=Thelohanellus kitauei TaxID=669202 RepID=A0A0C2M0Z4_THEKT|nr:Neurogenic locus notch protein 1 [Thelohanellus kitauei]